MRLIIGVFFSWMCFQVGWGQEVKILELNQLPGEVKTEIDQSFKKYQVVALSEKRKLKMVEYKVELQKKNKVVYLTYNAQWDLINTLKTKSFTYDKPEQLEKRENLDEVATPPI